MPFMSSRPTSPDDAFDVEGLIEQLTLNEKISLLSGRDFWHTNPVPRLNIPSIRVSDGPNGIRGTRFFDGTPSACLPCGTAIGATFNTDLAVEVGHLLADEARAKGAHAVLGPTVNIQRGPLGGRGFESFSEDPVVSGMIAGSYCQGLKEKNIIPTIKHFVCNDLEHERMAINAIVTDRAMRELYLMPFMIAMQQSQPQAVMTAYNKVNGVHVSENKEIIGKILRDEWKWKGLIMSDWFGTYSTTEAVMAGLDLEMPGPSRFRGEMLGHAVSANKIPRSVLDDRVRAVLEFVKEAQKSGIPENAPEAQLNRQQDRDVMRKIGAESIVLLKNDNNVLPLNKSKKVAVIGPNSKVAAYCGGGSAALNAYNVVTPFQGVVAQAEAGIDFSQGIYSHQLLPDLGQQLKTANGETGFSWRVFNEPETVKDRKLLEERTMTSSSSFYLDYAHPELNETWYAESEGFFTPEESGIYDFGLTVQGTAKLYIDDSLVVGNFENQKLGNTFMGIGTIEETGSKELTAGQTYKLTVQWGCAKTSKISNTAAVQFGGGGLKFGGCKRLSDNSVEEAVELARTSEQVVLFAGLSGEWESEGLDRQTMDLPPRSDELISRVLDVRPDAVVVIQSGTPVAMPWIHKAKSVVQAWYGGNETGNGIADVLFGRVNPSAKLPLTFPRRVQDNPTYFNHRSEGGRVLYGEDVYVGYRYYEKVELEPLFAFGHGLSYTTFEVKDLTFQQQADQKIVLNVDVINTGTVAGAEVVQVYFAPQSSPIWRPKKELKAFKKVFLEPGQTSNVEIEVDALAATSFWNEKTDSWCSYAGDYKILVGTSSNGQFLEETFTIQKTRHWTGLRSSKLAAHL